MSEAPTIKNVDYDKNCPILDHEQIDALLMYDASEEEASLARELYDLFKNEGSIKLEALPEVCAQNDTQKLRNIIHFIEGSAGNLGLARLAAFYRAIEHALIEEQLTDLSDCEEPIRLEFERACDAFRANFNL